MGLGVLPLEFKNGENADSLELTGEETISIKGIEEGLTPGKELDVVAESPDGKKTKFKAVTGLDSQIEIEYVKHGGILQYVLRQFLEE